MLGDLQVCDRYSVDGKPQIGSASREPPISNDDEVATLTDVCNLPGR